MPSLPNPLPVLCINLESDRDKLEQTSRLFGTLPFVDFRRSPGVLTRDLPVAAMRALTRSEAVRRGTLGCFLAHVAAWEAVAAGPGWRWSSRTTRAPSGSIASTPQLSRRMRSSSS